MPPKTILKRYSHGSDVGKWVGWFEADGKCIGFLDVRDNVVWMSELGL